MTDFVTENAVFRWTVMPMGIFNAPSRQQRIRDHLFFFLNIVSAYLDGIIVETKRNLKRA
eukprot:TRINITY_DN7903_c0_g1_i1.p1 TRINITY_DN7903_c0_g1~~TRINITY_DN7903_c0_g1_i1.p1  ORF type:complete len:60 (+),score=3.40 TRINITY_DN7903_c0_g1_i1:34-213(+)